MNNFRRRKEILIFAVFFGDVIDVTNNPKYEQLKRAGPFVMLGQLDDRYKKAVPSEETRARELNSVKLVVNALLPNDYFKTGLEQKLWLATQVVYRLIKTGWRLPLDPLECKFVQESYLLAEQMTGSIVLPDGWVEAAEKFPERLRRMGLYKN